MFKFWNFFLNKTAFSYLLVIALIAFGALSVVLIPKESAPEVKVPFVIVTTSFPGASAPEVEQLITDPIEEKIDGNTENVKNLSSTSRQGISSITVEFNASADLDASLNDVKDAADKAEPELPEEADDPTVQDVDFTDQPIMTISVSSDRPAKQLISLAETVQDELEAVNGVSRVETSGIPDREIQVIVQPEALKNFGLQLTQVSQAISQADASLPVGNIINNNIEYTVNYKGGLQNAEGIRNIPITQSAGSSVYVRDVATVSDGTAEPSTISRINTPNSPKQQAITFSVFKQTNADITRTTARTQEKIDELGTSVLKNSSIVVPFNAGETIQNDLRNLSRTGLQATLLVTALLFIIIGWREAILAGISIPLSFVIAFIGLYLSGNTINFISLFSLILAVGIMVDSAIVITEGMHSRIQADFSRAKAARQAIREFATPLTAGLATTVAVFVPLFFLSGITGEFIGSIPFTVISVLGASWFVTLAILPLLASKFLHGRKAHRGNLTIAQERITENWKRWYKNLLQKLLTKPRNQRFFFGAITVLFIAAVSLPATGIIEAQFFPPDDSEYLIVEIEKPPGTTLEQTNKLAGRVEQSIQNNPNFTSLTTTTGQASRFRQDSFSQSNGSHLANIFILLKEQRDQKSTEILEGLRTKLADLQTDAEIKAFQPNAGPPVGAPVELRFFSKNLDALENTTNQATRILNKIPGTREIESSIQPSGVEFALNIDRDAVARAGLDASQIARTLRTALEGTTATTLRKTGDDTDVLVKMNLKSGPVQPHKTNNATIDKLQQLEIRTPSGSTLLGSVADVSLTSNTNTIRRKDQKRTAVVTTQLASGYTPGEITSKVRDRIEPILKENNTALEVGGEQEEVNQSFTEVIMALIAGVALILSILLLQFNSFRQTFFILAIIPLSLIGVLAGLALTSEALSFPAMLGIIALSGVVVNNSIILIDVINTTRQDRPDASLKTNIIEASASRLRPVLLTAITTITGLIPLVFVAEIWQPLVVAFGFGLAVSAVILLFLIPVLYYRWPGRTG